MSKRKQPDSTDDKSTSARKSSRPRKEVVYTEEKVETPIAPMPRIIKGSGGGSTVTIFNTRGSIPKNNPHGQLIFADHPEFRPNLSPKEGSFGGTYFRPIKSGVTGESYSDVWQEFPSDWFEGLNIQKQVISVKYNTGVNKYKETCGGDLDMWESSGWITHIDPYGWFQWYCRFYLGRRSSDDDRQISRGNGVMGPKGRWRNNLVNKCLSSGLPLEEAVESPRISMKVRQLLQHWGYKLTLADLQAAAKKK